MTDGFANGWGCIGSADTLHPLPSPASVDLQILLLHTTYSQLKQYFHLWNCNFGASQTTVQPHQWNNASLCLWFCSYTSCTNYTSYTSCSAREQSMVQLHL